MDKEAQSLPKWQVEIVDPWGGRRYYVTRATDKAHAMRNVLRRYVVASKIAEGPTWTFAATELESLPIWAGRVASRQHRSAHITNDKEKL